MDKVEQYRQVFVSYKDLCAKDRRPCSFRSYCKEHGVDHNNMRYILKDEFENIRGLPGYKTIGDVCAEIYEDFKRLCATGNQPGTFVDFYRSRGVTKEQMRSYLKRKKLKVVDLSGYRMTNGGARFKSTEIPFENIIFEESGFLPAGAGNVITVSVDGHVAVSFPADTDVAVIARFIRKMGKEADHVGA